jgi:hypothetical protein
MALGFLLAVSLSPGSMGYLLLVEIKSRRAEEMRDLHAAWKLAIWRAELAKESSTFEGRQAGIAHGQTRMPPEPADVRKANGPKVTAVREAFDKRNKKFLEVVNSRPRNLQEIQRMFDEYWWSSCLEDQALAEQLNRRARERFGVSAGELPALMRRR